MRNVFRQQPPRRARLAVCAALGVALACLAPPASAATALGPAPVHLVHGRRAVTIHGQVVDSASKEPVTGAAVQVEGTSLGAVTDSAGQYRIAGVAAGQQTLVVRRVGYAPRRRTVTVGSDGDLTVDFALTAAPTSLNAVIVTGTAGGQQQRELGNAVGNVNAPDVLAKSQAPDMSSLLNSRVAGVSIVPNSGRLGAGPSIEIRGVSSLSLDNQPLIYIDGVRVSNRTGGGPTTFGNGGFGSQNAGVVGRLNDINPDEIESIQIIKGPAAATIYGTEAANGVIQIITKKGTSGKPVFNFQIQQGGVYFRDPEGRMPTNFAPDSTGAITSFNAIKAQEAAGRPVFTTGKTYDYNASVAGGFAIGNYFVSSNYQDEHGIEPNNFLTQYSAHANLNLTPDPKYSIGTSLNYVQGNYHTGADVGLSAMLGAELAQPNIFAVPGADGFYPNVPPNVPQALFDNSDNIHRFTGSATFTHNPISWFTQRLIVGLDYTNEDGRGLELFAPPALAPFTLGNAAGRIGQTLTSTSLTTADYNGTAKFNLTSAITSATSLGGQWYRTALHESFLGGIGFPGPGITTVSGTATALPSTQGDTINTTIGGYGQEEIGLNDRLFLTGALRVDNNSAFGSQFKWITYPKVSASWIVSEEPFWHIAFVNSLKLRAAYGESGRAPLAFSALRSYLPVQGPGGTNAFTAGSFGNSNLKPERGKELEAGFESDLWDRLHLDFTYFNKHTTNEIVAQPVAPSLGFTGTQFQNLGQVNNHGIELQATLQVLKMPNFGWDITGNFATAHNKIISLGGLPSIITTAGQANQVGFPIAAYFSRKVVSATMDPSTGAVSNVLCAGGAGQGPVDCSTAPFVYIGSATPTNTGSIGNTFTLFKKLRLYALVDWKRGYVLANNIDQVRCDGLLGIGECDVNYHPQKYSPVFVAEASFTGLVNQTQDAFFQDASFVKLREVSATYSLPDHLLAGIDHASFTVAARELALWTKFKGPDPEVDQFVTGLTTGSQGVIPPLSRFVATLNLTF
ncbi:MAG TPA: SusC/RagA family TonB-linked outer membrane protein [Gemmatimonadaceae bacterium]|nr:SusC/RagA family TonB-linked outer membrane protein [Gemmatimonadaceae bacterium]